MRIGLACDDSLDVLDGVQRYMLTVGAALRRRGHEVFYLVGETRRFQIDGLESLGRIVSLPLFGNVVRTSLPISARRARREMARLNLDVLHVQAPFSPFLVGQLLRVADPRTVCVATWHTVRGSALVGAMARVLRVALTRSLRRLDASLAVSPVTRDFVWRYYGVRSRVLGCPIDVAAHQVGPAPKPDGVRRIVYLGRLVPHKGPQVLLEAVGAAERAGTLPPGTEVVMVGDGSLRGELEQRAAQLRTEIRFAGALYGNEKLALLASADVAVFPSVAEAFGIVLLEAMAAGAGAVLAADNDGYRHVLGGDDEALFPVGDAGALAARLARVLADPQAANSLRSHQLLRLAQFDDERIVAELERLYLH